MKLPHDAHIKLSQNVTTESVRLMADALREGGVVVFPTETVYGIGCLVSPANTQAKQRVYTIKQRPLEMPLPLLIGDSTWIERFAPQAPDYAQKLAQAFWPGALTLILKVSDEAARTFGAASDGTLALRCPDHAFIRAVLNELNAPMYATSANTHGAPSPATAHALEQCITDAADLIVDGGPCSVGRPSTIVDCTGAKPLVVREGEISQEDIEQVLL